MIWCSEIADQGAASGVECLAAGGRDLVMHRLRPAESALRFAIPVHGVIEIALERVDDAMEPGGKRRAVFLHDGMGRLPVAGRKQVERATQIAIRHVADHSGSRADEQGAIDTERVLTVYRTVCQP